ncbi:MAG TPA: nitrile hydratase subunit beta, partial [Phenylobacterium sp.]|nr:nitrile hydratase subunit beta [Phenylobacterium sp.]
MNGVHDMGGMHGLGPIAPEVDEPVFHADWEARVLALNLAANAGWNIDAGRHQIELIPGPDNLRMSYY